MFCNILIFTFAEHITKRLIKTIKMHLTDDQIKNVIDQLNKVSSNGIICPVCGNRHWTINNIVTESREFQHGNLIIGGNSALVPYVTITCSQCAHTLFFNAIQIGIIDPKQEQNQDINIENNGR